MCESELIAEATPLTGTVYSSTVTHYPAVPLYETPYVVAVIEVDGTDRTRIVARVDGPDATSVGPGTSVRIEMGALPGGDFRVPVVFAAAREEGGRR